MARALRMTVHSTKRLISLSAKRITQIRGGYTAPE